MHAFAVVVLAEVHAVSRGGIVPFFSAAFT
jgi:hypothetical protein